MARALRSPRRNTCRRNTWRRNRCKNGRRPAYNGRGRPSRSWCAVSFRQPSYGRESWRCDCREGRKWGWHDEGWRRPRRRKHNRQNWSSRIALTLAVKCRDGICICYSRHETGTISKHVHIGRVHRANNGIRAIRSRGAIDPISDRHGLRRPP